MKQLEVFKSFEKILNWAGERNSTQVKYGENIKLCMSEIHVIEIIGDNPGILQAQISEKMGLTKGRISVIISNLIKKEMVIRTQNSNNKKELPLKLSSNGQIAFDIHRQQDKKIFEKMKSIMDMYPEKEVEDFNDALLQILDALQESKTTK